MSSILIAEDSPTQALAIKAQLQRAGFAVETAANGALALAAMERGLPDLVLTDLNMPEMDGLELVGAIRARFPRVPVVLMTAFGSEEVAIRALEAGAASYVPKRNLERDLVETLRDVLGVVQAARDQARLSEFLTEYDVQFELGPEGGAVMPIVARLQAATAELQLVDETERIRVGVALEAVLQNALSRGTAGRSPRFHLDAHLSRQAATFVLRHCQPDAAAPTVAPSEAGALAGDADPWGLLAKSFMDEIEFDATGNQLTMVKRGRG